MNFCTVAESKYFKYLIRNVQNIYRHHPRAIMYVGDYGLTDDERAELNHKGAVIVPMPHISAKPWFAMFCKPLFVLELIALGKGPVCWIDADCVVMDQIDFDPAIISVTSRSYNKKDMRINSGVFCINDPAFLSAWIRQTIINKRSKRRNPLWEQDALNQLIDSGKWFCKEYPCEIYNHYWMKDEIPAGIKVLHFKSGRARDEKYLEALCAV